MMISITTEQSSQVVELSWSAVAATQATVGDVLEAAKVVVSATDLLSLDGFSVAATDRLDSLTLHPGSCLRVRPGSRPAGLRKLRPSVGSIDVVAGLDAGVRQVIRPGRYLVGRSELADIVVRAPTVSRRHARLQVSAAGGLAIADIGSVNGVKIGDGSTSDTRNSSLENRSLQDSSLENRAEAFEWDEPVRLGSATILARRSPIDAPHHLAPQRTHAGLASMLTFNRMPRQELPSPPVALELPTRKAPEHHRPRFSWAAIVAPLIMGAAMALLWSPLYALFMVLSPLMSVMNLWEDKHRLRREQKQIEKSFWGDLRRFERDLQQQLIRERQRRLDRHVDLAELRRRATGPSVHLWERRTDHPDFLEVTVGLGQLRLDTALTRDGAARSDAQPGSAAVGIEPEVAELLSRVGVLHDVPIDIKVHSATVTGVTGRRSVAQAVVRSLVGSVAGNHGPADVEIIVLCSPDQAAAWQWAALLPHTADRYSSTGRLLIATTAEAAAEVVGRQLQHAVETDAGVAVTSVVVIDGPEFHSGRHAAVRSLAGVAGCALVVVAESFDWLPAETSVAIETAGDDGIGRVVDPSEVQPPIEVMLDGMSTETGMALAAALARFEDPEVRAAGAGIPGKVGLGSLLGGPVEPATIARRWSSCRGNPGLPAPLGSDEHGPVVIDLVADGPHALIGGTTGSGKSELLRSMVASMAASADAEHLAFVLIDYKGGSAFDRCADLPHTVGVVTDLDPQLSERALRCLNAELEYRERLLREFGADSIEAYRRSSAVEPLPRLVVVIDEFATMVNELPDFVDALVGIAQRGRSLGVHLVLATQRPSGAINDNIRTNTNLRIALRMLDAVDSIDVVGTDAAASIGRDAPGRACLRLGPGQLMNFQSALATGSANADADVLVSPVVFGPTATAAETAPAAETESPTELDLLVEAIVEVHEMQRLADPRCPWPAPLGASVSLVEVEEARTTTGGVVFGEVDDPDNQQKGAAIWNPTSGNGFVAGAASSGRTTTLRTLVISACTVFTPDELHVQVLDLGRGEFEDLISLPHVGAVVGPSEAERQQRLLHLLAREVRRRKAAPHSDAEATWTPTLFVLDGLDSFRRENDDRYDLLDLLDAVYLDGPSVGVYSIVSASSPTELRHFAAATTFRLYLRVADKMELREIGVRGEVDADPLPGRGHLAPNGLEVQVAYTEAADLERAASHPRPAHPAFTVGILSTNLSVASLSPAAGVRDGTLWIPLGHRSSDLETTGLSLGLGQHCLIAGPGRSGKTSALVTIGSQLQSNPDCSVLWFGDQSPIDGIEAVTAEDLTASNFAGAQRAVLLIDDVENVTATDELVRILGRRDGQVHLVAAGRVDLLRTSYGHWTGEFKQQRRGVLLWPDVLDGDVVGVDLPSGSATPALPGRGVLVQGGEVSEIQLAHAAVAEG